LNLLPVKRNRRREENPPVSKGVLVLTVAVILIAVVVAAYDVLDSTGWIPHREDTTITAETTWLIGESKECVSYSVPAEYANVRRAVGHAVDLLHCDSGPNHQMKVTFWGRVNQPEYYSVTWKCTREQDAFTCYELSGHTER
jgi:hypothetical protein